MMKISLITVSYNSEETIRETFESVRRQKIEGFELEYIHVDGLSNDSTMEISQEFDDIINIRISEKDSGIYNAMNKGVDLATGDVIGFLNSDDTLVDNQVLRDVTRAFSEIVDVVFGDINYVDANDKIVRKWRTGHQAPFSKGWHPAHPAFYARREIFITNGAFDEELRIAADFDLMLRFLEHLSLNAIYLNRVFVNMKLGGESNKSLKNILISKSDFHRSFQKYNIKPRFGYIWFRWLDKIMQRF